MHTCCVNDITITYEDAGDSADVLVLVHGHPFNRSMWKPQIEAFSESGWRVIAPDLRGYGGTTVTPGKTTLDTFAGDLAALLDSLGIDRCAIAGVSMGGQIVMEFVRLYGSRTRAVILSATFPQPETAEGRRTRNAMADRLLREGMNGYATEVLPKMLAPRSIAALPEVASAVLRMMQTTDPAGAAAALRGRAERPSYEDALRHLNVPTLIIVGDEDAFTSRSDADLMHGLVKGSSLIWMNGVGHLPNLESALEFNAEVTTFLKELPQ
jgi:pimeloyl-ACP methyl ester carboxylesterase